MGFDLWSPLFALLAAVVFVAGFLRGFVGFGAAMITVPVLSVTIGPQLAVPVGTLIGLPATLQLLPQAVRDAERKIVMPVVYGIVIAIPAGTALLVVLPSDVLKIIISVLVIALVLMLARGWKLEGPIRFRTLFGAGIGGGLVQGIGGVGGPPVVAVALSRPGPPRQQRANVLGVMTAISLGSFGPYAAFGLLNYDALWLSAALLPVNLFSTWLGSRYFSAAGHQHFRNAALAILGAVGVITLGIAVADLA